MERQSKKRTLIFSIATLDLLMEVFLYLALEDASARRLVKAGGLQDVCRVDPVVMAAAHYMLLKVGPKLEFPHRDLAIIMLVVGNRTKAG
jgi:hypothetical protein